MKFITLVVFALAAWLCLNAYCTGKPGDQLVNKEPVWKGQPRLLRTHSHGKLYEVGEGSTTMKMVHVYGNMYEMGFAHGILLQDQLLQFIPELWGYFEEQIQDGLPKKIPAFLKRGVSSFAIGTALDLTFQITRAFTNQKYYDQMHGICDASGVSFKILRRIHMIGELTKGSCSMFGAWDKATPDGRTVQLRALDWDVEGPFKKFPLLVVYHPSNKKDGNTWMNIGFVGWIGILSGVNEHKMGVSQIGVSFPDKTFGRESRIGNPFTFVLRDILQFDTTIQQSIHRLETAKRTCNLILGVGDGKAGYFRGFQYSHSVCRVVNDSHPLPSSNEWHPPLENTVYWGMDWNCPPFHQRLHEMLEKYHGNITAENTMEYILPGLNSGNLQAIVYDLSREWVYIAYGYQNQKGKIIDAYKRPYIGINLKQAFAQVL